MQKLHPNALWLFWIRSLLGIFPGGRKTLKFMQPVLVMILYVVVISYALFSLSNLTKGIFGTEAGEESGLSAWWQQLGLKLNIPKITIIVIVIFVGFLGLTFLKAYLYYSYYRYKIGESSLMVRKGVFSIHEAEVPFEKIQNVDIFRGILHRLLGLSSIYIQTAGYSESTEEIMEKHPGFVSEASIDGVSKEEAERIRQELMSKKKA
jgi:uncharacterized membrane protein YdbT with pleckstrin-like domain